MKRTFLSLFLLVLAAPFLWGGSVTSPANLPTYYSTYIDNKSGTTLFTGIHNVAKVGYSSLSYDGLWTAYATTDVYPTGHANAGKIWDMYGGCEFTYNTNKCGNYSAECDCYNREHSIPKSWFGGTEANNTPGSDIFHVVPTDGKVNGMRSNYAFGEVNSASYSYNGSKLGSPKSITIANTMLSESETTKSCSVSKVFEPIDEYKGDFARGYFGTMVRWANGDYQTFTTGDGSQIFNTAYDASHYFGLTQYGVALLLKWHRQDPVSQKEIDRNNGIQTTQGNRNPFIDYPILAEYLWGKYAGQTFSTDNAIGSFEAGFTPGVSDGDKGSPVSYSVSWMADGTQVSTSSTRPTDPNNCSDSRVFRGWTGTVNYSGSTAPEDLFTSGDPTITSDTTFYAVYADKSTSGSGEPSAENFVFANNGYTNEQVVESATAGDVTITFNKGTNNSNKPKYYDTGTAIRCYGGNTITVTATGISQIVFTFASGEGSNTISAAPGTYDADSKTWTGSANEVVFTIDGTSGHRRVKTISVTTGGTATTYSNFNLSCAASGSTIYGVDPSYYESLEGKSDSQLRSALTVFLYNHHIYYDKYDGANSGTENWDFPFDYDENGYVWDIYTQDCQMRSDIGYTQSCCCSGLNREHLVCQSTFGGSGNKDKVPQYADRHSLFLTDARTNQIRNDQPFGEVDMSDPSKVTNGNGTSCTNCTDHALGNKGPVSAEFKDLYAGSTEDVYEPGDEYKGDIARAILYMVVRYSERTYCRLPDGAHYNNSTTGVGDVVSSNLTTANNYSVTDWKNAGTSTASTIGMMFSTSLDINYGLSAYGKAILLKWHRQDPVSKKEIDRNAGVEAVQGNRNPFVDCPDLVEYLWGTKQGENFTISGSGETPTPTPEYTVTFISEGEQVTAITGEAGDEIQVSDPTSACANYDFYGWSTSQYATDNTDEPSVSTPTTIPAEDVTYYAVYTTSEEGADSPTNNYRKITTTSDLTNANYLIVADTSKLVAMRSVLSGYYPIGVEVTANDNVINTEDNTIVWQITLNNTQLTFYNTENGYLYIEKNNSYYNIKFSNNATDNQFTYSVTDGAWIITSVKYTDRQIEYYRPQARWTFYTSQNAPIYLYKQVIDKETTTYYTTVPSCSSGPATEIETQKITNAPQRILMGGHIFILRDGKMYNLQGIRVR